MFSDMCKLILHIGVKKNLEPLFYLSENSISGDIYSIIPLQKLGFCLDRIRVSDSFLERSIRLIRKLADNTISGAVSFSIRRSSSYI